MHAVSVQLPRGQNDLSVLVGTWSTNHATTAAADRCGTLLPLRRYIRHPGYLGWFVWAVAGQLLLANPITTVAFAYVVSNGK